MKHPGWHKNLAKMILNIKTMAANGIFVNLGMLDISGKWALYL